MTNLPFVDLARQNDGQKKALRDALVAAADPFAKNPAYDGQKQAFRSALVAVADPFAEVPAYGGRCALAVLGAAAVGTERAHPQFSFAEEEIFADLCAILPRAFAMANSPEKMRLVAQASSAMAFVVDTIASFWEETQHDDVAVD